MPATRYWGPTLSPVVIGIGLFDGINFWNQLQPNDCHWFPQLHKPGESPLPERRCLAFKQILGPGFEGITEGGTRGFLSTM